MSDFRQPPDGTNGRCRMYLWNTATPYRDGDLEAGIVIHELHPHVLLSATELRCVYGDEETFHATLLGVLDVLPGDLAIAVDVELHEELLVVGSVVHDLVEGAGSESGNL